MRALVCGDQEWTDVALIREVLVDWHPEVLLLGGGRGADLIAEEIAGDLLIGRHVFPVSSQEWRELGGQAGPLRNQRMLDSGHPDIVFAFHDDIMASEGTRDMVRKARAAAIPVWLYSHQGRQTV